MGDFLKFLNENSGALTVLFTVVVAVATVAYAVLTWSLVSETKKMREVQTEPKIEVSLVSFEFAVNIVKIHFKNVGSGPAFDLKISPSVLSGGEPAEDLLSEFSDVAFFEKGISYLGSGQERVSGYTQLHIGHNEKMNSSFMFSIDYRGAAGKKYSDKVIIDMSEYKGTYQLGKPSLYAISKSLEKIQNDIHSISSGFRRISVDLHTKSDREEEQREREEFYERALKDESGDA